MAATLHRPTAGAAADRGDVWARLAAPLPPDAVAWRQDGKPSTRDGRHYARFVAYVEAGTVRERLDLVVPGEWDLSLDLLPPAGDADGVAVCAFKARLTILGVLREDVGQGQDYKAAATDAFKRAAVRFGIAHELYTFGPNWVEVDGDGKWAKPKEDPGAAYARKQGQPARQRATPPAAAERVASVPAGGRVADAVAPAGAPNPAAPNSAAPEDDPECPKCGGAMWDNRLSKRNPKAPDFKCRDKGCDGVVWPARDGKKAKAGGATPATADAPLFGSDGVGDDEDDLPF